MLREVDEETGSVRLGVFSGELQPGKVYSGGERVAFDHRYIANGYIHSVYICCRRYNVVYYLFC